MINKRHTPALFCLFGMLALGNASSFAACPDTSAFTQNGCSLPPDLIDGSFAYFDQGAKVKAKNSKTGVLKKFQAKNEKKSASLLLFAPDDTFDIEKASVKVKANVQKDGSVKGSVKIKGKIDGLGISKKKTLMKADLTGVWSVSDDGKLFGANTENIVCHDSINAHSLCATSDVVYVTLSEAINSTKKLTTTGAAITSISAENVPPSEIPLPAAVWLFGSGLLGLVGTARHRKSRVI
jgi:hypothetical protein